MAKYRNNGIKDITNICKALGDINRVRIVMALSSRRLCVCQLVELLGLAPSTVSKHLSILKQAELIESHKNGRWVHYKLSKDKENKTLQQILGCLKQSLGGDAQIQEDKKILAKILKKDREELCRMMKRR